MTPGTLLQYIRDVSGTSSWGNTWRNHAVLKMNDRGGMEHESSQSSVGAVAPKYKSLGQESDLGAA